MLLLKFITSNPHMGVPSYKLLMRLPETVAVSYNLPKRVTLSDNYWTK